MNTLLNFYSVHYNIGAVALLIFIVAILLFSKSNIKGGLITLALFVGLNVFCFKQTDGMSWTREFYASDEVPKTMFLYEKVNKDIKNIEFRDTLKTAFAISDKTPWVLKTQSQNANMGYLHWCWVDDWWERFTQTDLVAFIWGENAGKKIRGSSETRLNYAGE